MKEICNVSWLVLLTFCIHKGSHALDLWLPNNHTETCYECLADSLGLLTSSYILNYSVFLTYALPHGSTFFSMACSSCFSLLSGSLSLTCLACLLILSIEIIIHSGLTVVPRDSVHMPVWWRQFQVTLVCVALKQTKTTSQQSLSDAWLIRICVCL